MKTYEEIEAILEPWTAAYMEAAQREGWDLITATDDSPVQVQRIDDPEYLPSGVSTFLPSDAAAMIIVRTGAGEHHAVARKILQDHFPEEWLLVEAAAEEEAK